MSETNSIKLSNFIPLSNIDIQFKEDDDTGVKHLYLKGIAHGFKTNLKNINISQSATRKAVRKFNADQKAGRIHQIWIDHAYINPAFLGNATPSNHVIGHVNDYKFSEKEGAKFTMDVNPDHPSQIHKAILRRDINGVSIGANVKKEDLICSEDGNQLMGDDCDHYWGQKLDSGKVVIMNVENYELDELTVTAKQADPEGLINLSDPSLSFTLDAYDKDGKVIENGLIIQKDTEGESLKNAKKYDRVDTNMTKEADVDNDHANDKSEVTLDKFNKLVDAVADIKQSVGNSNDALVSYLKLQEQKETDKLTVEKQDIVSRIVAKSKEFNTEELLKLDKNYLEKLERAIVPTEELEVNQSFGSAQVIDEAGSNKEKLTLSREDIKAWTRVRMGLSPEAPTHIQAKVKARLSGESYNEDDKFLQYLLDKSKE